MPCHPPTQREFIVEKGIVGSNASGSVGGNKSPAGKEEASMSNPLFGVPRMLGIGTACTLQGMDAALGYMRSLPHLERDIRYSFCP